MKVPGLSPRGDETGDKRCDKPDSDSPAHWFGIPGQLHVSDAGNGLSLKGALDFNASLPVGDSGGFLGGELLIINGRRNHEFYVRLGNFDIPFSGISGLGLSALPGFKDPDLEFLQAYMAGGTVRIDEGPAGIGIGFPIFMPDDVEH